MCGCLSCLRGRELRICLIFFQNFLKDKTQPSPSVNGSFLKKTETISRRQKLYETNKKNSDDSHQIQDGIYLNLSNENLHLFKNVFIGTIFKPKKNNGSYRFPNQEKFVYLIQLDTNEQLGQYFMRVRFLTVLRKLRMIDGF